MKKDTAKQRQRRIRRAARVARSQANRPSRIKHSSAGRGRVIGLNQARMEGVNMFNFYRAVMMGRLGR